MNTTLADMFTTLRDPGAHLSLVVDCCHVATVDRVARLFDMCARLFHVTSYRKINYCTRPTQAAKGLVPCPVSRGAPTCGLHSRH